MKTSVIIPVRTITPYVKETVSFLKSQSEKDFEIIIITDQKESLRGTKVYFSGNPTPAFKRNLGARKAKGSILAFLDDDSYPDKNWLGNALKVFGENEKFVGVCGPTLTPLQDSVYQKASGWVWSSRLGSGGAGVYRNKIMPRREVDDFPSVNLLVRKAAFEKVGGFDINHWPGEDTKLCLDLTKTGGKIIYDPKILVFHHRRAVFGPHLKQISRYAVRRGYFARVFPQTSFRLGYLIPSLFAYGLLVGLVLVLFFPILEPFYFTLIAVYITMLVLSGLDSAIVGKNLLFLILVPLAIIATHLTYGFLFPFGYFKKGLRTIPRRVDSQKRVYVGG